MPGPISKTYDGPRDGSVPTWADEPSLSTMEVMERLKAAMKAAQTDPPSAEARSAIAKAETP